MAVDAKVEEAVVPIAAKEEAVEEVAVVVQEVKVEVKEAPGVAWVNFKSDIFAAHCQMIALCDTHLWNIFYVLFYVLFDHFSIYDVLQYQHFY